MNLDDAQLPFTWNQIKSRLYKEKNRRLKPLRVVVFNIERYFELVLHIGDLKKYEGFLHFYMQTTRVNRPEPDEGKVYDDVVTEGWSGMPRYYSPQQQRYYTQLPRKEPTELWLNSILPLSEAAFGSLLERKSIDFPSCSQVLDPLGKFVEGYLMYDFGLDTELLIKFEHAYCRLHYECNN